MNPWIPTHTLEIWLAVAGKMMGNTEDVMLFEDALYTQAEWETESVAGYTYTPEDGLRFQGQTVPGRLIEKTGGKQ